jgi:hypothetical protein
MQAFRRQLLYLVAAVRVGHFGAGLSFTHLARQTVGRVSYVLCSECRLLHSTSRRCLSAWQPDHGRRSTYRCRKSVQTTGTTSDCGAPASNLKGQRRLRPRNTYPNGQGIVSFNDRGRRGTKVPSRMPVKRIIAAADVTVHPADNNRSQRNPGHTVSSDNLPTTTSTGQPSARQSHRCGGGQAARQVVHTGRPGGRRWRRWRIRIRCAPPARACHQCHPSGLRSAGAWRRGLAAFAAHLARASPSAAACPGGPGSQSTSTPTAQQPLSIGPEITAW